MSSDKYKGRLMFETNMNTENYISLTSTVVSTIARGHRTMLIEYLLPIAKRRNCHYNVLMSRGIWKFLTRTGKLFFIFICNVMCFVHSHFRKKTTKKKRNLHLSWLHLGAKRLHVYILWIYFFFYFVYFFMTTSYVLSSCL